MGKRPIATLDELTALFVVKVHRGEGDACWDWIGAKNPDGYGNFVIPAFASPSGRRKYAKAHRAAWYLAYGSWPDLWVLHRCDNPGCVRVSHLFLGDQFDNMRDKTEKGRHHNKMKTHCNHGHEFSPANTRHYEHRGAQHRACRTCDLAIRDRRYAKGGESHG